MKRFATVITAIALSVACAPKAAEPAGLVVPRSNTEFWQTVEANSAAQVGPGENGYIAAVGSGPTLDAAGVERPYTCFGFYNSRQITFPCPADLLVQ